MLNSRHSCNFRFFPTSQERSGYIYILYYTSLSISNVTIRVLDF